MHACMHACMHARMQAFFADSSMRSPRKLSKPGKPKKPRKPREPRKQFTGQSKLKETSGSALRQFDAFTN